jgi:hypothetical protein
MGIFFSKPFNEQIDEMITLKSEVRLSGKVYCRLRRDNNINEMNNAYNLYKANVNKLNNMVNVLSGRRYEKERMSSSRDLNNIRVTNSFLQQQKESALYKNGSC